MVSGIRLMEKVLFKVAKQWIAGDTIDDALSAAKDAYKNGRHAIVNKLGEYHTSKSPIRKTIQEYQIIVNSLLFSRDDSPQCTPAVRMKKNNANFFWYDDNKFIISLHLLNF